ncbi:ATP-binding cassette domain-containing protein [Micromonospora sp. NIE79]|uniref:ATP-binding cassette domain-containing protein n=2 Tax=Micromonospora trifolii TaxID=2911208 RepID=A0ABS9N1S1_9ACTN|nr:ATP-binding cassette domain-containing protein [Micromonospora trifolii]
MSQADCAAACLAMVGSALGRSASTGFWQRALGSGRDGTSVARLVTAATEHGLVAQAYAITDLRAALNTTELPAVLHLDGNHFVVVTAMRRGRVEIVDPSEGRQRLELDQLGRRMSGPLVVFRADRGVVGERSAWTDMTPRLSLRGVIRRSSRGLRVQLLTATAVMVGATLGPALLTRTAVNQAVSPGEMLSPWLVVTAAAGCLGLQFLGTLVQSGLVLRLRTRIDTRLMAAFVHNLLGKDLEFLEQRAAGDILSRISANAALRDSLTLLLLAGGLHLPLTLIYLAALLIVSPALSVIPVLGAVLQVAAAVAFGRRVETAQREALRADAELQINSVDAVNNYAVIKAMRLEDGVASRWLRTFANATSRGLRRDSELQSLQALTGLVQFAVPVTIVLAGVWLSVRGSVQFGSVLAMLTVAGIFLATLGRLVTGAQGVYLVRGQLERLEDIIDGTSHTPTRPAHVHGAPAVGPQQPARADVHLDRVSYRYHRDGADVVDEVSLHVRPGELLGIGGATGGGKTTLIHLLLGLYQPGAGTITRRRVDVNDRVLPDDVSYAYVPQDPELFSGTIRDNVLAWRAGVPDRSVWEALELAAVVQDVKSMPLGLDTPIGSRGMHLSGGQRQRLALARAFLAQPDLLVADEPTSHLDPSTEQAILAALRSMPGTRVVVAHSPQVLGTCDRAFRMTAGSLVPLLGTEGDLLTVSRVDAVN